jgi:sugar lactone lactonase YvrE
MKTLRAIILFVFIGLIIESTKAQIITTVVGNGTAGYSGDGATATNAELNDSWGIFVDIFGNIFIADTDNNRIRKVNSSTGIITTIAGGGTSFGDGGLAINAEIHNPQGVFVDGSGNVFIADTYNNRIRKINGSTGIINTIAGNGTGGYSGDGGQATNAALNQPTGVFVDVIGNVFIADIFNYRIRKVNSSTGIISTIAGDSLSGYTGDGVAATTAELNGPMSVFVDGSGDVFIADYYGNRIQKVNGSTGIISTIAGTGNPGYLGDGEPATSAELNNPSAVFVDSSGNVFIADAGNERIRKVNGSTGLISTIAGNGIRGYTGDGAAATSAEMWAPSGVSVDALGNVFIADSYNNRIRKVCNSNCSLAGIEEFVDNIKQISIYPNPNKGSFVISSSNNIDAIKVTDTFGQIVYETKPNTEKTILQLDIMGVYFILITSVSETITKKVIVE